MIQRHIDAIQIVANNDSVKDAVKALLYEALEENPPLVVGDDAQVGQSYRAYRTAKNIIDAAFVKLDGYQATQTAASSNRHI